MANRYSVTLTEPAAKAMGTTAVEDVGADGVRIHESGALMFLQFDYDSSTENVVFVYAAGSWVAYMLVAE